MKEPTEIEKTFRRLSNILFYKIVLTILGLPLHMILYFIYLKDKKNKQFIPSQETPFFSRVVEDYKKQIYKEKEFFEEKIDPNLVLKKAQKLAAKKILEIKRKSNYTYFTYFECKLKNKKFIIKSSIVGFLLYGFLWLYSFPIRRYIVERFVMSIFVILGVSILVFTIMYFSPLDPAANILGESATVEQKVAFNEQHGLDQPYFIQLKDSIKGIITFDLGKSFSGKEEVSTSIANKFPITFKLAILSLLFAMVIAIPVGIISAARTNSFWDYGLMFLALLGLSIPSFWQGLIMILEFSINLHLLPATYSPNQLASIIMPVIVLGTGLTASVARMTRSSILEVIHEDYILTAKSKGLSSMKVFLNHALRNAMIPIITVLGLQFGAMIGGAAVIEKVFNISGLGSYIVDKQFIPDIPAVMGGVVYIAITISVVNLIIDILYAFINPRVRSKMNKV